MADEVVVRLQSALESHGGFTKCLKHVDKLEYFYCLNHQALVCELCDREEHKQSNCQVVSFANVALQLKEKLGKELKQLKVWN